MPEDLFQLVYIIIIIVQNPIHGPVHSPVSRFCRYLFASLYGLPYTCFCVCLQKLGEKYKQCNGILDWTTGILLTSLTAFLAFFYTFLAR